MSLIKKITKTLEARKAENELIEKNKVDEKVLNELSKMSLKNYINKAVDDVSSHSFRAGESFASNVKGGKFTGSKEDGDEQLADDKKAFKRQHGIIKAANKLAKDEVDESLEEGLRLVGKHTNGNKMAKVYKDNEWEEHRVKFHTDGKHHTEADYHTNDAEDAHSTAKHWVGLKEETINELSQKTLKSYVEKAKTDLKAKEATLDNTPMNNDVSNLVKKIGDRENKMVDAKRKLPRANPYDVVAEGDTVSDKDQDIVGDDGEEDITSDKDQDIVSETEQLAEISKKTLGSYIDKALDDVAVDNFTQGAKHERNMGGYNPSDEELEHHDEEVEKTHKRENNIRKAVKKLTKEAKETEHGANLELAKTKNKKGSLDDYLDHNDKTTKKKDKTVKEDITIDEGTNKPGERPVFIGKFIHELTSHPMVDKIVNAHYLSDGATALIRMKDGNAYEIIVTPSRFGKYHQDVRKADQFKQRNDVKIEKARKAWGWETAPQNPNNIIGRDEE